MIYKDFKGEKLSALGLGCMRLPTLDGDYSKIDEATVREMVAYAFENGINYFDTAWGYHEGKSEPMMGKVLSEYPRESYNLASKFPGFSLDNMKKVKEIFESQLERCRTEYFDFYLFHNLCESNIDWYLDPAFGLFDYLVSQKRAGRIRHLGFSSHANLDTMKRFLDAYSSELEFCQLQINYVDFDHQKASEKVKLVASYGIPVWVMEPVRGGKLASLDDKSKAELDALRPGVSAPEWAFRFVQSIPEVVMTLSGMSNMEQLKANIETYKTFAPASEEERNLLREKVSPRVLGCVPCTACRYCTERCPMGLDIPSLLSLYNDRVMKGGASDAKEKIAALDENKRPSACLACRSCEAVCPQNIKISEAFADFNKRLEK